MLEFKQRYLKLSTASTFIFGPRGTGKSTFLKQVYPEALTFDLRSSSQFRQLTSNPDRIASITKEMPHKKTVIIDEIQRVPELLPVIHKLIEEDKSVQFIMTGSSARKLKKQGVDLLAGRALRKEMYPYMCSEINSDNIDIDVLLKYGMLPLTFGTSPDLKQEALEAYISLYMEQEVYQEALVRNIGDFGHFLEIVSLSHGSILNVSNIARDSGINRKTVESFIQILEDILLAYKIPVFTKKASRDNTQHPKFYFFDSGVFQAIRLKGPLDHPAEVMGNAIEGLVAQHLKAWIAYTGQKNDLYFWRNRYQHEVDFILYGETGLFAIEVKYSNEIRKEDLKGIESFLQEYPTAITILLYMGKEVLKKGNVWVIPIEKFLMKLVPGKFELDEFIGMRI